MVYSEEDIITQIKFLVIKASQNPKNKFSPEAWENHISLVYEYGIALAEKMKADVSIVKISALLHDYASLIDACFVEDHHIHSSRMAQQILESFNYPPEKIGQIFHCIMTHRGSKILERKTIEAECLASADALSHIINFPSI